MDGVIGTQRVVPVRHCRLPYQVVSCVVLHAARTLVSQALLLPSVCATSADSCAFSGAFSLQAGNRITIVPGKWCSALHLC